MRRGIASYQIGHFGEAAPSSATAVSSLGAGRFYRCSGMAGRLAQKLSVRLKDAIGGHVHQAAYRKIVRGQPGTIGVLAASAAAKNGASASC